MIGNQEDTTVNIASIFDAMISFLPEPIGNTTNDQEYLTGVAKSLLALSKEAMTLSKNEFAEEIEDFATYVRDPTGFQENLDREYTIERAEKEREREEARLQKAKEQKLAKKLAKANDNGGVEQPAI